MQGRQFNKISVSASLMMVIVAVFWVWSTYQDARAKLDREASESAQRIVSLHETNSEHFGRLMTQVATVIGNQRDLKTLFYDAKLALEAEGGGAGGDRTAALRDELFARLSPGWQSATEDGVLRELHFHFPPATSFLRLHRPANFGDDLSAFRASVVAANKARETMVGFEMGIASGGIRGVVPISYQPEGGPDVHIGTVEAGMGLSALLDLLGDETGAEFALLVDDVLMRETMIADTFTGQVAGRPAFSRFRLMDASDPADAIQMLASMESALEDLSDTPVLQYLEQGAFALAVMPIRDFSGEANANRREAGVILAWVPMDDSVIAFKREVAESVVIALFVVFFLEAMLFFALGQEQKLAVERKASVTDALTGVSNRRHFDEVLDAEIRRGARSGQPISLILADVDYFKRYNDHYGHQVGDECLRQVAACMSAELRRAGDFIARYGGEEFVVVLPDTSLRSGLAVAEKLRRAIETLKIRHEKHPDGRYVTASFGVAAGRVSQHDSRALVAMADEALYRAKGAGRNNTQGLRFGDDADTGQPLPLLYR